MKKKFKNQTHSNISDDVRLQLNKRTSFDGNTSEKSPSENQTNDPLSQAAGLSGPSTPVKRLAPEIRFPFSESPPMMPQDHKAREEDLEISALKLAIMENTDDPRVEGGHRKAGDIKMIETYLKKQSREEIIVKVPSGRPLPRKPLIISSCLLLISVVLLIVGTYLAVSSRDGMDGLACWILGSVCGLPGVFYTVKFFKICRMTSEVERQKAMAEIPRG